MNLLQQFDAVFNRRQLGVAKITGDLGGSAWAATAQGGSALVLQGNAAIGSRVFYDKTTNTIVSEAPDLDFTDLSV
ncbi:hypothetical protein [Neisseria perflava]|uniref:hypothetical protein n=1 Tax=Neisseria perflava TaxID=33053 RepID=UPI00209E01AA|nr:hypothetical protein [Neisseria perflava]MCP1659351.1 hypothetical protein [Neisseria perflava]MCP1772844.1 hypothetical protein [Neisseria perflava]